MHRARLLRAALALTACAAVASVAVSAALAAGPEVQERVRFTETDPDFCGTGKTVVVEGRVTENVWFGETGGEIQVLRWTYSAAYTLTNPETGAVVTERWATMGTHQVMGLEGEAHTHEIVERGLKATVKLAHGRVLTRDAGSLRYWISFDDRDNIVGIEFETRGPHPSSHPSFDADFCDVLAEALGL